MESGSPTVAPETPRRAPEEAGAWSGIGATLREDLLRSIGLAVMALVLGIAVNALRPAPLPWRYEPPAVRLAQASAAGEAAAVVVLVSLEEMQALAVDPTVLLLDARPDLFYQLGHIPGAAHLPKDGYAEAYAGLEPHLRDGGYRLLVIYCSGGDCEDSVFVVEKLRAAGHGPLAIFEGGWEEWEREAGR
jgi:rhodanese-related sulfurtransferase